MRNIEEMSDHEILVELLKEKRRNEIERYVRYVVTGALVLGLIIMGAIYIPKIIAFTERLKNLMTEAQIMADSISSFTKEMGDFTGRIDEFTGSFDPDLFKKLDNITNEIQMLFNIFGVRN